MENAQADPLASLSREVIRGKIADLNIRERDLCQRAHEMWKSGSTGSPPPPQHVQDRHARARQILNGAGALLPPLDVDGETEGDIQSELSSIRLALDVLNKANRDREALERASWAAEHSTEWLEKTRKLTLAMIAAVATFDECHRFLSESGQGAEMLPAQGPYWATLLTLRGGDWAEPSEILRSAVADGIIKQSEIKGVLNAR